MIAIAIRRVLLTLVTISTVSVTLQTSATAQSVCYRPDGSMYIGRDRPADCSPTRPKSRDEDIQRRSDEEAVGRVERDAARRAKEGADNKMLQTRETARRKEEDDKRVRRMQEDNALKAGAERAILLCDSFKSNPRAMNREQEVLCTRHWSNQADRTLKAQ